MYRWYISTYVVSYVKLVANSSTTKPQCTGPVHAIFPNGKESDKFTPGEILEILEWSIPEVWRTKFDLAGYVPTEFTKEKFMTECEAVERNEPKLPIKSKNSSLIGQTETHKKSRSVKFRSSTTQKPNTTFKYYCTEHGQNTKGNYCKHCDGTSVRPL